MQVTTPNVMNFLADRNDSPVFFSVALQPLAHWQANAFYQEEKTKQI